MEKAEEKVQDALNLNHPEDRTGAKLTLVGDLTEPTLAADDDAGRRSPDNLADVEKDASAEATSPPPERRASTTSTSKIILTSYPGQAGVDPIPLKWGKCKQPVFVS